jgi:hypothetical protein
MKEPCIAIKFSQLAQMFPAAGRKQGFARAKTPRTPSPEFSFFAAFAPLREILGVLVAGLPPCGKGPAIRTGLLAR